MRTGPHGTVQVPAAGHCEYGNKTLGYITGSTFFDIVTLFQCNSFKGKINKPKMYNKRTRISLLNSYDSIL